MITLKTIRELLKPYRLKAFPPYPKTLAQFGEQLDTGGYDKLLNYENNKLSVVTIEDQEGFVHILFYDQKLLDEFFKDVKHIFVDGTYQTRPNIKHCSQLLNVLAVISGVVRNLNYY